MAYNFPTTTKTQSSVLPDLAKTQKVAEGLAAAAAALDRSLLAQKGLTGGIMLDAVQRQGIVSAMQDMFSLAEINFTEDHQVDTSNTQQKEKLVERAEWEDVPVSTGLRTNLLNNVSYYQKVQAQFSNAAMTESDVKFMREKLVEFHNQLHTVHDQIKKFSVSELPVERLKAHGIAQTPELLISGFTQGAEAGERQWSSLTVKQENKEAYAYVMAALVSALDRDQHAKGAETLPTPEGSQALNVTKSLDDNDIKLPPQLQVQLGNQTVAIPFNTRARYFVSRAINELEKANALNVKSAAKPISSGIVLSI